MLGHSPETRQPTFLMNGLSEILNSKQELYLLGQKIPWHELEKEFAPLYSKRGRPAKPIRLMVALLILKQMYNLSDENLIDHWVMNPYYQFFSGEAEFQWHKPCDPSDLVYFRERIGKKGFEKILAVSIAMHGAKALEKEIILDTTVQEKNITFPTDTKLQTKVIEEVLAVAKNENIPLRQTHKKEVKKLLGTIRFNRGAKQAKAARKAAKRLKIIAKKLHREVIRKLSETQTQKHFERLNLHAHVLFQRRQDKNKIYSLHEPQVYCVSKGKAHKKYEFGSKASIALTKTTGIIVGAYSLNTNVYDGHTVHSALKQVHRLTGSQPDIAIADRGYRGQKFSGKTEILTPRPPNRSESAENQEMNRKRQRRRASIEATIGHLKLDHRLARNFLKGSIGDSINLLMAAAAYNFKKFMKWLAYLFAFIFYGQLVSKIISKKQQTFFNYAT